MYCRFKLNWATWATWATKFTTLYKKQVYTKKRVYILALKEKCVKRVAQVAQRVLKDRYINGYSLGYLLKNGIPTGYLSRPIREW